MITAVLFLMFNFKIWNIAGKDRFYIFTEVLFRTFKMFAVYHVGGKLGWSDLFSFTTMKSGTNWSPVFAVFGDMGNDNVEALPYIQEEAQRGQVTAVLHTGSNRNILNKNKADTKRFNY